MRIRDESMPREDDLLDALVELLRARLSPVAYDNGDFLSDWAAYARAMSGVVLTRELAEAAIDWLERHIESTR